MKYVYIKQTSHCLLHLLAVLILTGLVTACSIDTTKNNNLSIPFLPAPAAESESCINPPNPNKNSACPLDALPSSCFKGSTDQQEKINGFDNGKCEYRQLVEDTTFYRYFDNVATKVGGFYITEEIRINESDQDKNLHNKIIKTLALNQKWGNSAKMLERVTFPKGTVVFQGKAASQGSTEIEKEQCYPGGGAQIFILNDTLQHLIKNNQVWFSEPHDYDGKKNDVKENPEPKYDKLFSCPPKPTLPTM